MGVCTSLTPSGYASASYIRVKINGGFKLNLPGKQGNPWKRWSKKLRGRFSTPQVMRPYN